MAARVCESLGIDPRSTARSDGHFQLAPNRRPMRGRQENLLHSTGAWSVFSNHQCPANFLTSSMPSDACCKLKNCSVKNTQQKCCWSACKAAFLRQTKADHSWLKAPQPVPPSGAGLTVTKPTGSVPTSCQVALFGIRLSPSLRLFLMGPTGVVVVLKLCRTL